jgi:hypothetical protein
MNSPELRADPRAEKKQFLEHHLLLINARGRWAEPGRGPLFH